MEDKNLRSITPNPPADFTPTLGNYQTLRPFRMWCQKVLPLVYDDSLSYYELLCKVVDYLNKTMEDVETLSGDVNDLHKAYQQLQDYVNNYFSTLDVQEEIDNKLDEMARNGQLTALISPLLPDLIADWLSKNLTSTSPPVDKTLTISGAAADAKVVGDTFKKTIINNGTKRGDLNDANNILTNSIYFVSETGGVTTIENTPIKSAGWLQTINTLNDGSIYESLFQLYYPWNTNNSIFYRVYTQQKWTEWKKLPLNGMSNYTNAVQANATDANKITEDSIIFVTGDGTYSTIDNVPILQPQWLITYTVGGQTNTGVFQISLPWDTSKYNIYYRSSMRNVWNNWQEISNGSDLIKNYGVISGYTSSNDIDINSVYFVGETEGQTNISDLPVQRAGWLQTINIYGSGNKSLFQIYYPWFNESTLYYRARNNNEWQSWKNIPLNGISNYGIFTGETKDANNIKENSIFFATGDGVTSTVKNMPVNNPAWIFTVCVGNSPETGVFQLILPWSTEKDNMYFRSCQRSNWSNWYKILDDKTINRLQYNYGSGTSNIPNKDANNVKHNSIYFISETGGITNLSNLPEAKAQWLQTINIGEASNVGVIQFSYPWQTSGNIWYRICAMGTWSNWKKIGAGGETVYTTIEKQTVNNTYNITSNPIINTDTNGWLVSTNDKTDRTGDIMNMLNSVGYCRLSKGYFYISGNIDMPDGATIEGCGKSTIVVLLGENTDNGYCFKIKTNNTIKNLSIQGNTQLVDTSIGDITARNGIVFEAQADTGSRPVRPCYISNVYILNFTGSGIYCYNTGDDMRDAVIVMGCEIEFCRVGINIDYFTEYCKFTNVITYKCYYGCINNGGNNVFTGCTFYGRIGFVIDNTSGDKRNNAHGSCIGCTFNHCDNWVGHSPSGGGDGILIKEVLNGFIFSGCQIWYSKINIQNGRGILFNGCLIGGNTEIETSGNYGTLFTNCMFNQKPPIVATNNTKFINCYLSSDMSVIDKP